MKEKAEAKVRKCRVRDREEAPFADWSAQGLVGRWVSSSIWGLRSVAGAAGAWEVAGVDVDMLRRLVLL